MLFYKIKKYIKNNGLSGLYYKSLNHIKTTREYKKWLLKQDSYEDCGELSYQPLISVIVPVYNVEPEFLEECIHSVMKQTYTNWELCLVDDASTMDEVATTLKKYEHSEKIKVIYREKNGHISEATNTGVDYAIGEFLSFLDCDDILSENALYEIVALLNKDSSLDFIYTDEDKISENGKKRMNPFFKPDWSPDTIMSIMYTCHLAVFRKSIIDEVGGFRIGYEGAQDYDLVLRVMEKTRHIAHISKVLYHWRQRTVSTAMDVSTKPYVFDATRRTLEDALIRRNIHGKVEYIESINRFHVVYDCETQPRVSIILIGKEKKNTIRCITSLCNIIDYSNYEIILMKAGEEGYDELNNIPFIREHIQICNINKKNTAEIYNRGVNESTGRYILFLDTGITITNGDLISRMVGHAGLEHIGAVGCKLIQNGKISHTGICSDGMKPRYVLYGLPNRGFYYFERNWLDCNYAAVSGLCMMIAKDRFEEMGGFDTAYTDEYYDIDLCYRLYEQGYYNVIRNDVCASVDAKKKTVISQSLDNLKHLQDTHLSLIKKDPYYNENLSKKKMDFSLDV